MAHAIFEDGHGRHQNHDREQERADRVSDCPLWLDVDDCRGDNDTDALYHIADHVDDSCANVQVFFP